MQQHTGKTLGSYQILEQIGQGGMATVFRAYQPSMDRYVAIKILPSHFTEDKSFLGRFTQEARTLAHLEHPHILPVHDYGEQDGVTYLVMRYVQAGTLKELIAREGPMELNEAARILDQVGRALDYAHSQDVVHRDVKPSNVLVDQQRNTFLTDFGIAKLVAETAQFTATGAIIGTPAYMSPEQGMGEPADYRCDIYSLGVVLYELVTGRVPFEAETPLAVLLKHINDPLPLPRQIRSDLPQQVELVILKATAKAPDDRYQSAQDMTEALALAVAASPAETVSTPVRAVSAEASTLARSISAPPSPAVVTTPPSSPADTAAAPLAADIELSSLEESAPARRWKPWLIFISAGALVVLLLIAGLVVLPNLMDDKSTPRAASQGNAALTIAGQPTAVLPSASPEQVQQKPGWTNYGNGNFVSALARQDDALWAGGESGLVRWDVTDGSYAKFERSDELISRRVTDLLVDDAGMLWIATDAGIGRFDGGNLTSYGEVDGLDARWIRTLFLDNSGGLWAGSRGGERGLNFFDGQSWGPPPIPPLPVEYPNVQTLVGNEEQGLFVGLEDGELARFDGEEWTVLNSADGLPSDGLLDALLTDDALWVSFDQAVVRLDLGVGDMETFPQAGIYAMHQAADGKLWLGGDRRVVRFDPETGDWHEFETAPGPIPGALVTDLAEDDDALWFGTYGGGVLSHNGSHWETWTIDEEVGGNWIEAIQPNRDGTIWFTHPGSGLSRYDPEANEWQVFGESEGALDWPSVPDVDSDGNLWIGEYGELVRYDGESWERFKSPELTDVGIYAIEIGADDVMWLVTDSGLMRHNPDTDEWKIFTGADHPIIEEIWSVLASSDGTLWLGGEQGLVRYDGSGWSTPIASGNAPQFVEDLAEAPDGSLWMTADSELVRLADGQWSYFAWPADGSLNTVAIGTDVSVWVGQEGLGRYSPASGEWQLFTPADGLVHFLVRAIYVTSDGVVWIGTEGGISRYVPPN